jgi:hypothetical protein
MSDEPFKYGDEANRQEVERQRKAQAVLDDIIRRAPCVGNRRFVLALVHEDAGSLDLQIDLGNDHAIHLVISEEDGPRVIVWTGSGEHDFDGESRDGFREWLAEAAMTKAELEKHFNTKCAQYEERARQPDAVLARRTWKLAQHVEAALTKPSTGLPDLPFSETVRQLREIVAVDVTEDEILMAAHRVRARYQQDQQHSAYARYYFDVVKANCARWSSERGEGETA